jgi:ribose 5-phosphate isomerase B
MRIAIGADHRGYQLKDQLVPWLRSQGHEVEDKGAVDGGSVDYPDFAAEVARQVSTGKADRGLLVCATGVGMCIAANKVRGVRATTCADEDTARLSRQHNDVNVLCLAGDRMQSGAAEQVLTTWLQTPFEGGRHARRIEKIAEIERQEGGT